MSTAGNRIVRNVYDFAEAVSEVRRAFGKDLQEQVVVEYYPARYRQFDGQFEQPERVFSYQFFGRDGRNCAYYLPDLNSLHVFGAPREWGIGKPHVRSIEGFAQVA